MPGLQMRYFVLKPSGSTAYNIASRKAMREYSKAIADENPELAIDLEKWIAEEDLKHYTRLSLCTKGDKHEEI